MVFITFVRTLSKFVEQAKLPINYNFRAIQTYIKFYFLKKKFFHQKLRQSFFGNGQQIISMTSYLYIKFGEVRNSLG